MAHVNSRSFQDPDGIFLYQMEGNRRKRRIGGPYPSNEAADEASRLASQMVGESSIEDYVGFLKGPITTTRFEGTPNPWGDLPTEREQADFRRKTRGIPSGGFDWRNIIPNTRRRFQGLFEQEEDSLLDYNPEAELHEALQRTGLEEQYLSDPTRYSGPEPPVDRGWTAAPQKVMQAMGRAFPQAQAMTRLPEGLLDHRIDAPLEVDQFRELRPRTEKGGDLALVGRYNLSDSTRTALEKTGELPWYKDRAYLAFDAAADFNEFNEAYQSEFEGQDIPIESAYRDKRHNAVLKGSVSGSLHLEGKAFDVGVDRHSTEWKWLKENAPKYGWEWHEYKEGRGHFKHTGHRFLSGIG
jgi:hypothetical protein